MNHTSSKHWKLFGYWMLSVGYWMLTLTLDPYLLTSDLRPQTAGTFHSLIDIHLDEIVNVFG